MRFLMSLFLLVLGVGFSEGHLSAAEPAGPERYKSMPCHLVDI